MPRGGGGGFRGGGGFGGGGFRGGGSSFRGSSFRSSSFRSSGRSSSYSRPFGRTGAARTRTSTSRGPYRHHTPYYRRRHHYWHRPYYRRRWYYRPWYSGYYYRPWYYSPAYWGGGVIVALVFLLILLPVIGLSFAYPFSGAGFSEDIRYSSVETLYYNEYWYEHEQVSAGGTIEFTIGSSNADIRFAIADHGFNDFPVKTVTGEDSESFSLSPNEYIPYQIWLEQGSTIEYEFNASSVLEFFIVDGENFYNWDISASTSFYEHEINTTAYQDSFLTPESFAQDYYLVWFNSGNSSLDVDVQISFNAVNIIDFSGAAYSNEQTNYDEDSYTVLTDGDYYFFIYFDPFFSLEEQTEISFSVTFKTNLSNADRWINSRPVLIVLGIIGIFVLWSAVSGRKQQKINSSKTATQSTSKGGVKSAAKIQQKYYEKAKPAAKTVSRTVEPEVKHNCIFCDSEITHNTIYCHSCGRKQEGRKIGTSPVKTPAKSEACYFCGRTLLAGMKFCPDCGSGIK